MKPNYIVIRGGIFTDLTSNTNRTIYVEKYFESKYEAEDYAKELANKSKEAVTYYVIGYESSVKVTLEPNVFRQYVLEDIDLNKLADTP
jgi:uncharacterized protein YpiB (UPF0302 family)